MSSPAQAWSRESEAQFLEGLRPRYEAEGFAFTIAPDPAGLPGFLGSYVPDAIARKPGLNIAIEVKRNQSPSTQKALQEIRRLFAGHDDWQFNVIYMGTDPLQAVTIPPASPAAIRRRMEEVVTLDKSGHHRAAFVVAWSLLEAALHSLGRETVHKPLTPGMVVQALAMNGYIDPDMERRMRALVELRNRIVHGDLSVEPASAEILDVLSAIEATLSAEAA